MATHNELHHVDRTIWRACAGNSVQIPSVDSRVYYFPQGHAEQSSSPPFLSPLVSSQPLIYCRVLGVRYLANQETDEVFARIRLLPVDRSSDPNVTTANDGDGGGDSREDESVASFAKILTPSDANNGGGFSVPRFCADSIFPRLNFAADPPVQNISLTDIHGTVWEFRHIYRGTPRRHLLTTGWSKFVNSKKLVAGDSVVFMRNKLSGELFVGVRRAVRFSSDCGGRWNCHSGSQRSKPSEEEASGVKMGFSRNGRGRVSAESVAEAAEFAVQGREFEIVYYPKAGWADFVVKAELVEKSLSMIWTAGMRVKMAMETEDSSRMTWFQGTVSSTMVSETGPWRGSPWRMLQVTWDEPEALQNVKRVSPWQLEYVPTPSLQHGFHPTKKIRATCSSIPDGGEKELFFPLGLSNSNSPMGAHLMNPSLMINYTTSFPAGMQGARQEDFSSSGFFGFTNDVAPRVSTELNIGGSSHSDNLSPDSQSSVHFFGGNIQGCNSSTKENTNSFQLFGKVIQLKEPPPMDGVCFDDGSMEDGGITYKESVGVSSDELNLSLSYPCTNKLFDSFDVQRQRARYELA